MLLSEWEVDTIKECLEDSRCGYCGGKVLLYGVYKIKRPIVKAAIHCDKCKRRNHATFKMPKEIYVD